jgi:hypothetical protein
VVEEEEEKGGERGLSEKGRVAPCEWVGEDNEILPSQPGCDR